MSKAISRGVLGAALLLALCAGPAHAQDKIRVGLIYTLSGPAATLGQQARNGFELAVKTLGGRMAGRDVEIVVVDDELKPDVAVQKVKGLLEREKVDFVVGPIFANVLQAIHKPVTDAGKILISTNTGPSSFAGKACHPSFFVTSYQNDQSFEVLGKVAQDRGYKRLYVMVPNYQAGKDAVAGFRRHYTGEVIEESYVPLGTLDFQAEVTKINALKPDALFTFMPGGMGINLVKQFDQAGLRDRVPFLSAFTVDEATLPALGNAADGLFGALTWAPGVDNPENRKFVSGYDAAYQALPASYAMQAYDAAMLIDSAVRSVNGDLSKASELRQALHKADFKSVRGPFKFNTNNYPLQNYYLTKVGKRADGRFETQIVERVFENYGDAYVKECAAR